MSKKLIAVVLGIALVSAAGWQYARAAESKPTLTPQDYIEIQNLYATYSRFTDMGGAGDASDYASLYTPDGEFNDAKGTEALKKLIKGFHGRLQKQGWSSRHIQSGLVITPTAEGAKASVYFLTFNVTAKPAFVDHSGVAEDWLVKTKDGWKYKKRVFRYNDKYKPSMRQGMDELAWAKP